MCGLALPNFALAKLSAAPPSCGLAMLSAGQIGLQIGSLCRSCRWSRFLISRQASLCCERQAHYFPSGCRS